MTLQKRPVNVHIHVYEEVEMEGIVRIVGPTRKVQGNFSEFGLLWSNNVHNPNKQQFNDVDISYIGIRIQYKSDVMFFYHLFLLLFFYLLLFFNFISCYFLILKWSIKLYIFLNSSLIIFFIYKLVLYFYLLFIFFVFIFKIVFFFKFHFPWGFSIKFYPYFFFLLFQAFFNNIFILILSFKIKLIDNWASWFNLGPRFQGLWLLEIRQWLGGLSILCFLKMMFFFSFFFLDFCFVIFYGLLFVELAP